MQKIFKASALTLAMTLAACGGGGGSSGATEESYSITLRTDKTQLPLNVGRQQVSMGAYAPYSTALYVDAAIGGRPIPGGEEIFSCNMSGGLNSGALYYLDGKPEHEVEIDDGVGGKIKVPGAYRSITLGSNSGGNSFHFHASDQVGTARITCSVTDPRDKQQKSAYVDITVGTGSAVAGQPASIKYVTQAPGYLGSKNNLGQLRNNVGIQAFIMDDANQPVPNPIAANMQIRILPSTASRNARLLSGGQDGNALKVRTVGGVGQFSLSSGIESGSILLELTTDRLDNNIDNGIQDAVTSLMAVSVHDAVAATPLMIVDGGISVNNDMPFFFALSADGGVPPYQWSTTDLPNGLTLSNTGVLSGTTRAVPGTYSAIITVTDSIKKVFSKNIDVNVGGALLNPLAFDVNGCTGEVNTACALPPAANNVNYAYAFSANGGDATQDITWTYSGLPTWLKGAGVGNGTNGVITGMPPAPAVPAVPAVPHEFFVTASQGSLSITRKMSIRVN